MLDLGAGYRSNRNEVLSVSPDIDVITVDNNAALVPDFVLDASDLKSFEDATIGCVVCTELLEHVPRPDLILNEVRRILKPGGFLILTVPFRVAIHEKPMQPDYWRFTPTGVRYLLHDRFSQVLVEYVGAESAPDVVFATAQK